MANISQHEAAELWELARDHFITAAKLQFLGQHAHDTQLRSLTEQHARRMQQAGHQIAGLITQQAGGAYANQGGFQTHQQGFSQFQSAPSFAGEQSGLSGQNAGQFGFGSQGFGGQLPAGVSGIDILVAGEGLKDCKRMAVALVYGATECSQPARNILYQLAGEQLQMAEQCYRWLDQKGVYASPKADFQATNEYSQKVRQISQAGQQATQEHASMHQQHTMHTGQFGQSHLLGAQHFGAQASQPQYGTQAYTSQHGGYQPQAHLAQSSLASTGAVRSGQQYNQ